MDFAVCRHFSVAKSPSSTCMILPMNESPPMNEVIFTMHCTELSEGSASEAAFRAYFGVSHSEQLCTSEDRRKRLVQNRIDALDRHAVGSSDTGTPQRSVRCRRSPHLL